MKKIISLFLALLMAFSVVTVAFATDGTDAAPDTETSTPAEGGETEGEENEGSEDDSTAAPDLGELDWLLDLPFWTVGPAFKFAKIAFKLVTVYLKVAKIFGLVDKDMGDMALELIMGLIKDAENGNAPEEDTTAPETTTAPEVSQAA